MFRSEGCLIVTSNEPLTLNQRIPGSSLGAPTISSQRSIGYEVVTLKPDASTGVDHTWVTGTELNLANRLRYQKCAKAGKRPPAEAACDEHFVRGPFKGLGVRDALDDALSLDRESVEEPGRAHRPFQGRRKSDIQAP